MLNELPKPGSNILLSFQERFQDDWVHCAYQLNSLGFNLYCTEGTHAFLEKHDIPPKLLH